MHSYHVHDFHTAIIFYNLHLQLFFFHQFFPPYVPPKRSYSELLKKKIHLLLYFL